jgi:arsenate reductase
MRLVKAFGSVNAVAELMVYEKRTCTTCKNLAVLLQERGIDFDRVDYHVEPLSEREIRELVGKTGRPARELFRAREPVYEELELAEREPDDDEAIRLMVEHPELMQRPVVVRGDRAVLARPVERVLELLDD